MVSWLRTRRKAPEQETCSDHILVIFWFRLPFLVKKAFGHEYHLREETILGSHFGHIQDPGTQVCPSCMLLRPPNCLATRTMSPANSNPSRFGQTTRWSLRVTHQSREVTPRGRGEPWMRPTLAKSSNQEVLEHDSNMVGTGFPPRPQASGARPIPIPSGANSGTMPPYPPCGGAREYSSPSLRSYSGPEHTGLPAVGQTKRQAAGGRRNFRLGKTYKLQLFANQYGLRENYSTMAMGHLPPFRSGSRTS